MISVFVRALTYTKNNLISSRLECYTIFEMLYTKVYDLSAIYQLDTKENTSRWIRKDSHIDDCK